MADDKRTKIGATGPVSVPATNTPVPATQTPVPATSSSLQTSYLPQQGDPLLGQTLAGRYSISKKLGEGGMGAVYLATHTLLDKQVALKVLHGEFARKPDLVERFMQEAKAASRIRHENVIDISDFGTTPEGLVFFAMELLKGHDLHEEVARARLQGQLLPWERSKKIFLQICSALAAAHAQGIIHRDLKPENVYLVEFLGEPDFVKLLDFGIAKLTEVDEGGRKLTKTGMLFGTPEYMSPEQARGEQVDHRVDVYAMGCILFQLVTGRVPFEADNFMGVLSMHLTEPAPSIPPDVFDRIGAPRDLAKVIDRALQKDRNARWGTIDELAHAIRAVCGDPLPTGGTTSMTKQRPASVPAPATTTQARQRTQWTGNLSVPADDDAARGGGRSKLPLILGAVLLVGGAAAAAVFLLGKKESTTATAGPGPGSGPGSGSAVAALVVDAGPAVAPPAPDAAPELPPLPERVTVVIDSKPAGAEVINTSTGKTIGKTKLVMKVKGSREPLPLKLTMKRYGDVILEITPDRDVTEMIKLEKGASGTVVRTVGGGTTTPAPGPGSATTAVTTPDPGPGSATVTPDPKPDPTPKPPDPTPKPDPTPATDDCPDPDMPCLKTPDEIRRAKAAGGDAAN